MRILIDLTQEQLDELARLAAAENRSRASVLREAVGAYIAGRRSEAQVDAYGLWGKRKVDGLEYQAKLRGEW